MPMNKLLISKYLLLESAPNLPRPPNFNLYLFMGLLNYKILASSKK